MGRPYQWTCLFVTKLTCFSAIELYNEIEMEAL